MMGVCYCFSGMLFKWLSFLCIPTINYKSYLFFNQSNESDLVTGGAKIHTYDNEAS